MSSFKLTAALITAVALSACTDAGQFGGGGLFGNNAPADGGDFGDPTSAAYFQNAIGDRVLFTVDQAVLTDEGRAILDAQAGWLQVNPDYVAIIEGHADNIPVKAGVAYADNWDVSLARAKAVVKKLVRMGVSENQRHRAALARC